VAHAYVSASSVCTHAAASTDRTRGHAHQTRPAAEALSRHLDARRDWGYARDYVEAMWLMMQAPEADDFVIATGESRSVREFLDQTFGQLDLDWKEFVEVDPRYYRPAEVEQLLGDASKAREKLGWKPRVAFKELVRIMVDHDLDLAKDELTLREAATTSETRRGRRWSLT